MIKINWVERTQKILKAHLQIIESLKPSGPMGAMVKGGAVAAHAYAQKITHVDTGNLKASHRIDPNAERGPAWTAAAVLLGSSPHPRSGIPAEQYGFYEHDRGGSHAFYERTAQEAFPRIARGAVVELLRHFPQGE